MAVRRILHLGDPTLRIASSPCDAAAAKPVFENLADTLHQFQRDHGFGRGISAIQIGEPLRLIYIEFESVELRLRNPVFEWRSEEKFELWDDCFSFPDLLVRVQRWLGVSLRYEDAEGRMHHLEAAGALSELLQHEMDHLDGILAVDRAIDSNSLCTREEYLRRFAPRARSKAN